MKEHGERPSVKTILLVEDDKAICSFVRDVILLETLHQLVIVTDGREALEKAQKLKPDLLILNYQLPQLNGIEVYDRLHAMPGLEKVPAIMISANLPEEAARRRNIQGIKKPFDLDTLLEAINTVFSE